MERRTTRRVLPACPTLFTPLQAHPRELLRAGVTGAVAWMKEHVHSLQQLVARDDFAVVVSGADLCYHARHSFLDGETIEVDSSTVVHPRGLMIRGDTAFSSQGQTIATAHAYFRPVRIGERHSATAKSSALPPHILTRFLAEEVDPGAYARPTRAISRTLEAHGEFLAAGRHPFRLYRSAMDYADQWTFMEACAFASAGREELAFRELTDVPQLREALAAPVRQVCVELARPAYLFDEGRVETAAYAWQGRLYFLHRLAQGRGAEMRTHAVVVEQMASSFA